MKIWICDDQKQGNWGIPDEINLRGSLLTHVVHQRDGSGAYFQGFKDIYYQYTTQGCTMKLEL